MIEKIALTLRSLFAAASVAVLGLALASASASAEPGLWVAKGANATVFLFGTIHVLQKGQAWEAPQVADALAASQELWLEVPDPGDAAKAQTLMGQLGFDRTHPLSSKLSPDALTHLDSAAKALGVSDGEKAFEPMRPWLASVALENALIVHAGYDPESGVEATLLHDAQAAGKSIRGFETLEQQMHFFADMKPALELQLLQNTLQDFDEGPKKLTALIAAWLNGDEQAITRTMVDEVKQPFPALYRTILVDRNEAWAGAIAAMLKGSGVRFIAVGAAHLAGPDSVQAALERRAVHVERITAVH